ncbi:MAG: polymerase sigma-70 factor [Mucilaginibacter sp.]|nr:polymerase sigma-70 factor [Mucilaginibacter sp.]
MNLDHQQIVSLLPLGDEPSFERVYKHFFKPLHVYALNLLKDEDEAAGVVQSIFLRLWERENKLEFSGSVRAYLYGAVSHECLNYLRNENMKINHQEPIVDQMKYQNKIVAGMELIELKGKLQYAINDLPEGCRAIFQLSRFEQLKYEEIADYLHISIKTVEGQMGRALRMLMLKLVDYLPMIIWFIVRSL